MLEQEIKANYERVKTDVRDIVVLGCNGFPTIRNSPSCSIAKNHKKWVCLYLIKRVGNRIFEHAKRLHYELFQSCQKAAVA